MSIISRKGLIMANETTTKNDSTNVSFGKFKVGGYAYVAPVGTALPTDSESALDPAFQLIGYLSEDGIIIVTAAIDGSNGQVLSGPDLVSRGFVFVRENESLMDGAQSIVENALERCVDEHVRDWNSVKTRVREALSSYIYRRTKRSPMILPILMEV